MNYLQRIFEKTLDIQEEKYRELIEQEYDQKNSSLTTTSLDELLRDKITKPQVMRNHKSKMLHGSALIDFCPREAYFRKNQSYDLAVQTIVTSDPIVWLLGKKIEEYIRDILIESDENGNLVYGFWRNKHTGVVKQGTKSDLENPEDYIYDELDLICPDLEIFAHPDLYIANNQGKYRIIEIKSLTKDKFADVVAAGMPVAVHKKQALHYYKLSKEILEARYDIPIADELVIIYACRDYLPMNKKHTINDQNSFKSYTVNVSPEDLRYLDDTWVKIRSYVDAKKHNRPSTIRVCDSVDCERAKKCPVVSRCFR